MRPLAIALVLSLACASTREAGHAANDTSPSADGKTAPARPGADGAQPGAAGATTAQEGKSASQPHDGAQPQSDPAQSRQSASPASATATTAAEAAAAYAREHGGGGGGDAGNASGTRGSSRDGGQGGARDAGKNAAGDPGSGASASDESCASDADCGFTRVGPEETACCPMLCSPRVVSKKHAGELDKRIASCNGGRECPQPSCRPPPHPVSPACEAHRCVGKPMKAASERD